jgi:hypothetical protein
MNIGMKIRLRQMNVPQKCSCPNQSLNFPPVNYGNHYYNPPKSARILPGATM